MNGVDLVTVQQILGHQDIATTLKYSHVSPAHLTDGVNMGSLGSLLQSVAGTVASPEETREGVREPVDFLVRPEGLEPPTLGSEVRCSIQLSYGRTWPISITPKKTLSRTGLRHSLNQI